MVDVSWDRLQVHVNGWGGHFVDPADPTRFIMDESPALAAFEWLRARMWDDHVLAGPLDVQRMGTHQAFLAGRLAMVEDGSWALKDVLTAAKFRVGVAPFPAGPARRATLATTDGFGIYSGSRYRDAAWSLLQYLTLSGRSLAARWPELTSFSRPEPRSSRSGSVMFASSSQRRPSSTLPPLPMATSTTTRLLPRSLRTTWPTPRVFPIRSGTAFLRSA